MNNNKLYCPCCKVNEMDWDWNLGMCDQCAGIDDESWSKRPDQVAKAEEKRYLQMRKSLWARVYERTYEMDEHKRKMKAGKIMGQLVKKVHAWSFYDMDLSQLNQAFSLTNYIHC